jgi:hypothetical protein
MKPPQRPVGALVIAILNFVFGGFALLNIVCGGLSVLFLVIVLSNVPPPPPPPAGAPARPDVRAALGVLWEGVVAIPGFVPYAVVSAVKSFIAPFLLLFSGYGLVKMRRYGRSLAIVYAILTLVFVVIDTGYAVAFLNEGIMNAYQNYLDKLMEGAKGAGGAAPPNFNLKQMMSPGAMVGSSVFSAVLYAAYPIAILAVMYRRDVRDAYSGNAPVVLPSERKRSERVESRGEKSENALPGARPDLEEGVKDATEPGVRPRREEE